MALKIEFKNATSEKRWIELHKEKVELQGKKLNLKNEEKLQIINSLMTGCKTGFSLNEAKIKKIIRFLKTHTGSNKIRYGSIPKDLKVKSVLFKDIVISYVEKDGQILFKEN